MKHQVHLLALPKTGCVCACLQSKHSGDRKLENQKFKVSLSYTVDPGHAGCDSVKKEREGEEGEEGEVKNLGI